MSQGFKYSSLLVNDGLFCSTLRDKEKLRVSNSSTRTKIYRQCFGFLAGLRKWQG